MKITRLVAALALASMATPALAADILYISEYTLPGVTRGQIVQVPQETSLDSVTADFTSSAQQSNVFATSTNLVRLWCSVQCSVVFGKNPSATANSKPLAAATPEYFWIPAGQGYSVSVHTNP